MSSLVSQATMKQFALQLAILATGVARSLACLDCDSIYEQVEYMRRVKRIQPGVPNATYGPTRPLEWGQVNFLHTVSLLQTKCIGWLIVHADRHTRLT